MPAPTHKTALGKLAELHGIETFYIDMKGRRVTATADALLAMLRALGVAIDREGAAAKVLKMHREELSRRIDPVRVVWDGRVDLRKFRDTESGTLILEDGNTCPWPAAVLPIGYHRLVTRNAASTQECLIISAPSKAHFPSGENLWGVFAPAYALRSKRDFGSGDLTDLETLVSWTAEAGGRVVATLPMLAAFLDRPFEPSPYSPASRLFWNEFFADLAKVPEFPHCPEARELFARKRPSSQLVQYRERMQARRRIVEAMARTFYANAAEGNAEFADFTREGSEVRRYAEFRAAVEQHGIWRQWPEKMRVRIEKQDRDEAAVRYHLYAQWIMTQQLRSLRQKAEQTDIRLYLDLPLGIHSDGYDTWRFRELFLNGISGGAPPDPVFPSGQNWAFPPLNPQAMRADHYRYVIAAIRNHLQYAQLLRVDHIMGLHHIFCIPDGMPGKDGLYLKYPAEELYAILSLESHRHNAGIVGEDLGLVPSVVRQTMKRHNLRGLYILQVEPRFRPGEPFLRQPPAGSVASLNTHDMFPFAGFLDGQDIEDYLKLGFLTAREAAGQKARRQRIKKELRRFLGRRQADNQHIFEGCMSYLARSAAAIVLVNLEDLWGETRPQNIPATTKERPNWRRRMRYSMEELKHPKRMKRLLEIMKRKA